ncbi:hypothetical protein RUM43_013233 [Polyplax serrata]|uniref:Uncharacterized protein n=1 Tax=Polyplax serrata TaxID=468196 RepID=A0AAN8NR38_POLSC
MMNRLEKYYEPHPQQILRRTHNTMLMLPPPPLIQEGHGSLNSSRSRTWSSYNTPGVNKPRSRLRRSLETHSGLVYIQSIASLLLKLNFSFFVLVSLKLLAAVGNDRPAVNN